MVNKPIHPKWLGGGESSFIGLPGLSYNNGNPNDNRKYSGKELDKEHGLDWYYFGARYYDPAIGHRFFLVLYIWRENMFLDKIPYFWHLETIILQLIIIILILIFIKNRKKIIALRISIFLLIISSIINLYIAYDAYNLIKNIKEYIYGNQNLLKIVERIFSDSDKLFYNFLISQLLFYLFMAAMIFLLIKKDIKE